MDKEVVCVNFCKYHIHVSLFGKQFNCEKFKSKATAEKEKPNKDREKTHGRHEGIKLLYSSQDFKTFISQL